MMMMMMMMMTMRGKRKEERKDGVKLQRGTFGTKLCFSARV